MAEVNHSERAHAKLSPSSAHRYIGEYPCYLGCTAAPGIEADLPDTAGEAAQEGTLCHERCELKLREWLENKKYTRELNKLKKQDLYQREMENCSDGYVDFIKDVYHKLSEKGAPQVYVEQRVDISAYLPDCFGTADCVVIGADTLHIIDYKHGKGVKVNAEHNPQLMLYALGAYNLWAMLYGFKKVALSIYQPRIDNISTWECSVEELIRFGELVKAKAQEIEKNPAFRPSEEACRFCKARATCKARGDHYLKLAGFAEEPPALIKPEDIKAYIDQGAGIDKWLADLKDHALKECLAGHDVPGLKAVHGRSIRAWKDQQGAFDTLKNNGWDEAVLYKREPITLSAVEKLIGKKDFESLMNDFVVKPPGKPTLVDEDDKREAIKPIDAKDVF